MPQVVGVRFRKAGKIYYFDPGDFELPVGSRVIVETVRGVELGAVVIPRREVRESEVVTPLRRVCRPATPADEEPVRRNSEDETKAFAIAQQKIAEHGLPMKLIGAEYTLDRCKLLFYFTAEGRVDFRALVRDLAGIFHTRIELRQVGVRDEAKALGGIGCCGRELCCASFLGDFDPVSIKMAKDQNLSLNPSKISGICGRLMCCLRFENEFYEQVRHEFPRCGQKVQTPAGAGRVVGCDPFKEQVAVELDGRRENFARHQLRPVGEGQAN